MKVLRLDLRAFGHFRNVSLDLSGGEHGLHLIYAPNEGGKSTALRALHALFYGVERGSTDDFRFGNQLRIGGQLQHSNGRWLEFQRGKETKNRYLDAEGRPADESELQEWLRPVNASLFATLFGLNHEGLVQGGRDILRGGGLVGESLFAAGLGGGSLLDVLEKLDEEAAELFRPHGQNQAINRTCKAYDEAKKRVSLVALSPATYLEHENQLHEAQQAHERIAAEASGLRLQAARLQRLAHAVPLLAPRAALLAELAAEEPAPALPASFGEQRLELLKDWQNAGVRGERAQQRLRDLEEQAAGLSSPAALLREGPAIEALYQRLGSYLQGALDLSQLKAELSANREQTERLVATFQPGATPEQAAARHLPPAQRRRLQELITQEAALLERHETARRKRAAAERENRRAEERLPASNGRGDETALRAALLQAQRGGSLEASLTAATADLEKKKTSARLELARFRPWSGSLAELEQFAAPSAETVARFEQQWQEQAARQVRAQERVQSAMDEARRSEEALAELLLHGPVPSEQELIAARLTRTDAWQAWRTSGVESSPAVLAQREAAYLAQVAEADRLADALRHDAERAARQAQLRLRQAQLENSRKQGAAELAAEITAAERLRSEWQEIWGTLPALPPAEMRVWLQQQKQLLIQAAQLRADEEQVRQLGAEVASHRAALQAALTACGVEARPATLEALIEKVSHHLETLAEQQREREQAERELQLRQEQAAAAREDEQQAGEVLERWKHSWGAAMEKLGWSATEAPAEVHELMARGQEVLTHLGEAEGLQARITAIEAGAADFHRAVRMAEERLEVSSARPPEVIVPELYEHLSKARQAEARAAELQRQIAATRDEGEQAKAELAEANRGLAELCRRAGCREPAELEAIEARWRRQEICRARLHELETRLGELSAGTPLPEFLAELADVNPDAMAAQLEDNEFAIQNCEERSAQYNRQIGVAELALTALDGNSRASEAQEEACAVRAQLEGYTDRYIRLRLASAILKREIERYRAENQDPLLQRAGELFSFFTLGSFSGITAMMDEKGRPVLRGARRGEVLGIETMSEGTRDQLFLALQMASIEKAIRENEPMPFIADDLLVAFDQAREAAVLRSLGELSRSTQVILFTHHAHLKEIARATLDAETLIVHELPTRSV